jgi:hypothetical protein
MESNWAAENLQTIRTLMERSAVYRRALAPVMIYVGIVGVLAAIVGWALNIENTGVFSIYWMAVSLVAIAGAFLLVRRQALKSGEPFWSPPTRRIAQAMLPALLIGFVFGMIETINYLRAPEGVLAPDAGMLATIWGLFYGLALNSAGFFMPRGIKWFGWAFVIAGLGCFVVISEEILSPPGNYFPQLLMGILFGASHLAYGIYLYFTEPRKNEA